MARKKQEAQLQTELETQEQWDDMLSKEGLTVVDVYQEWCGPCTSMVANLRRLRNELAGDELLKFAVAKADTVEALEKYRGKCEPCFHLYAGGQLVNIVRSANSPLLMKLIVEELNKEKKVLAGEADRTHFVDPILAAQELARLAEKADEALDTPDSQLKEVSVAIIKPNVFAKGNVNDVVQAISEKFEVLAKQEFTFSEDWVKEFYAHIESEPIFEELIEFMTSGPCMIMVLTNQSGENACAEFRSYIGPKDPSIAKQENPSSLRALFGDDVVKNGVHGSEPGEAAAKETTLVVALMPDLVIPKRPPKPRLMQFTILIPPESLPGAADRIKSTLEQYEFRIVRAEEVNVSDDVFEKVFDHLRKEDIEEFSRLHKVYVNTGASYVFVVEKLEGIPQWVELFGPHDIAKAHAEQPDSLAAQIYREEDHAKSNIYFAHMPSRGRQDATFMLRHLDQIKPIAKPEYTIAAIKPDALLHRDVILQRIHESGFQIVERLERKLNAEQVMRMYINHNSAGYFSHVMDNLTSGPTMFLILYREEAIHGWRNLMGPSDPTKAKAEAPDSIRAMIGHDIIKNAVFGADGPAEAKHLLTLIWGQNAQISDDGRLENATPIPSRPASSHSRKEAAPKSPEPTQPSEPAPARQVASPTPAGVSSKPNSPLPEQPPVAPTLPSEPTLHSEPSNAPSNSGKANSKPSTPTNNLHKSPTPPVLATSPEPVKVATPPPARIESPKPIAEKTNSNVHKEPTFSDSTVSNKRPSIPTIVAHENFDAKADCEALNKAMQGIGADEDKMTSIMTRRSWQQRVTVAQKFKEMYGKDLADAFKSESSGDYQDLIVSLTRSPPELAAHNLNRAMKGTGTDEDCLIEIICTSTWSELEATKAEYEKIFGKTLESAIVDESSGSFRDALVKLLNRKHLPDNVDNDGAKADANRLLEELSKGGKEGSDALVELLAERNHHHLLAVFEAFKQASGREIEEEIKSRFQGDAWNAITAVIATVRNKDVYFAKRLRASTEGMGTRDAQLIRIVIGRAEIDLETIKKEYEKLYGVSLLKHVADDTSGDYRQALVSLITGNNFNQIGRSVTNNPPKSPSPPPVPSNLPKAPSIPPSPVPEPPKPVRTDSKASVRSVAKSIKEAPTPSRGSPVVKAKEPTHSPANAGSRRSSVASVKSITKPEVVSSPPPAPKKPDDEEEAKEIDG